ncbi:hypothetical protein V1525DRAFT_440952, partial [Lipomyces kononenkoae]
MDSNSDLQRPSRAKRLDYYAMNMGTDSEGDSDEGLPSRSRRRLDESQSRAVSDDIITLDLANDAQSSPSLPTVIRNTPTPPKSWVWEHFHTAQLETAYIHRASKKGRSDRLVMCTRCSWTTTDAVLQGSSGNLSTQLRSQHKMFKPGTPLPESTSRVSGNITS